MLVCFFSGFSQAGSLDFTFDGDGIVRWDSTFESVASVVVQPDGKTIAGGTMTRPFAFTDMLILRFNVDGSLDTTFADNGSFILDLGLDYNQVLSLCLQPDGKIIALANSKEDATAMNEPWLLRLLPDGTLDNSFNGTGRLLLSSGFMHQFKTVLLHDDGRVLAVGRTDSVNFTVNVIIRRFLTDGTPDTSFGTTGTVVTDIPDTHEYTACAAIQPDQKIVVAGTDEGSGSGLRDFFIHRYSVSGTLDSSFDTDGIASIDITDRDNANSLVLQADGKVVVAGYTDPTSTNSMVLARLNADGSPDNTFDLDGILDPGIIITHNLVALAMQPDGQVLAATSVDGAGSRNVLVMRFNPDGSFDTSFDGDGMTETDLGGEETATCMAFHPDGKIVIAGYWFSLDQDVLVLRYHLGLPAAVSNPEASNASLNIYPNPVHETATAEYTLSQSGYVDISIHDLQGNLIKQLSAGEYRAAGRNRETVTIGDNLPSGLYLLVISSSSQRVSARLSVQ